MSAKTKPKLYRLSVTPTPNYLIQYLRFLLLAELDPCRDPMLVEKMESFYDRYSWALKKSFRLYTEVDSFLQQELIVKEIQGFPGDVTFLGVPRWKKCFAAGAEDTRDADSLVPCINQTIAGVTIKIYLQNAFVQQELKDQDREKAFAAVVQTGKHTYTALMVISDSIYEAMGDEPDEMRYAMTVEFFQASSALRALLFDAGKRYMLARALAYLATIPNTSGRFTKQELLAVCQTASQSKAVADIPHLLELLGFASRTADANYQMTGVYNSIRHILAVFGGCIGCSCWTIKKHQSIFDAVTRHFPQSEVQMHMALMVPPADGQRILEPLLQIAEANPDDLAAEERRALFDFMMKSRTEDRLNMILFSIHVADVLLSDTLLPREANFFIESFDEIPSHVLNHMEERFKSSTSRPVFYYVLALQAICEDEPSFAISMGEELVQWGTPETEVLGFAILGTLAKAAVEGWSLSGIKGDTIAHQSVVDKLIAYASTYNPAQTFYQKMLSNLICAGYIPIKEL